eukprot:COSAG02_NODE_4365_length_5447_cov_3.412678_1_plen_98_part_10
MLTTEQKSQLSVCLTQGACVFSQTGTASLFGGIKKTPTSNGFHAWHLATVFKIQHVFPDDTPPTGMSKPNQEAFDAALHMIKYAYGQKDRGIRFNSEG